MNIVQKIYKKLGVRKNYVKLNRQYKSQKYMGTDRLCTDKRKWPELTEFSTREMDINPLDITPAQNVGVDGKRGLQH